MTIERTLANVEGRLKPYLATGERFTFLGVGSPKQNLGAIYGIAVGIFGLCIGIGIGISGQIESTGLTLVAFAACLVLGLVGAAIFVGIMLRSFFVGRTDAERVIVFRNPGFFFLKGELLGKWQVDQLASIKVSWSGEIPHVSITPQSGAELVLDMAWLSYAEMADPTSRLARLSTVGQLSAGFDDAGAGTDEDDDETMDADLIDDEIQVPRA